jgi:hypothetical protein
MEKPVKPIHASLQKLYMETNLCKRVLLFKLTVAQLVKKYPAFMEPEGLLHCSQEPACRKSLSCTASIQSAPSQLIAY